MRVYREDVVLTEPDMALEEISPRPRHQEYGLIQKSDNLWTYNVL